MFEIALTYIRVLEDTTESGHDEPYAVVLAFDLADTGLIPVAAGAPTMYGPFQDMAASFVPGGSIAGRPVTPDLCWGFNGQPRDIDTPNDPLILVALLESDHDDFPPDFANSVTTNSFALVNGSLLSFITARNQGTMDLATLRNLTIDAMRGAVDTFRSADIEKDERLGSVQRLPISAQDLIDAQNGIVEKKLSFVSSAEDSKYELTFSIGTGVGSVSSGLSSSGPTDRYAAIWVKDSGPAWVARHRLTPAEYQQQFDEWTAQGYRLVHVSGYNHAGSIQFAAIWEKSAGPAWVARHNMTSEQYQAEFDNLTKDGYRLAQVSGYHGLGKDLYAAIWRKESGPAWVARHRMTSSKYQQEFNQLTQQGYRLADVSGYRIANAERYAAIWRKTTDSPWVARHGMSSVRYQREFNRLVKEGYRLVHVNGCRIGGMRRFAAIWEKSAGPAWVARHDMTSEQYQAEFNNLTQDGYRPICVSGY
jgi:Polyglycine hydrolase-like, structural repeat